MKYDELLSFAKKFEKLSMDPSPDFPPKFNVGDKVRTIDVNGDPFGPGDGLALITGVRWEGEMVEEYLYQYYYIDTENPNIKVGPEIIFAIVEKANA